MTEVQSYWDNNGKFQALATELQKLVPASGKVVMPRKNKKLEKFRAASNAYYDIFNNGGCNRYHEIRYHFQTSVQAHTIGRGNMRRVRWNGIAAHVDPIMDKIVLEAAVEQGIIKSEEDAATYSAIMA